MFRSQTSSFGRVTVVEPLESRVFMAADAGTLLAGPRLFIRGGGGWDDSDTSLILPVKQVVTPRTRPRRRSSRSRLPWAAT